MSAADDWLDLAAEHELKEGDVTGRWVGEREIALYRHNGEVFATDATCTHGDASLCGGFVEPDGSIECPLHQGRFDIRSGQPLCEPVDTPLVVHPVKCEGGRVYIRVMPAA